MVLLEGGPHQVERWLSHVAGGCSHKDQDAGTPRANPHVTTWSSMIETRSLRGRREAQQHGR